MKSKLKTPRQLNAIIKDQQKEIQRLNEEVREWRSDVRDHKDTIAHIEDSLRNARRVVDIRTEQITKLEGGIVALNNLIFMLGEQKDSCVSPHVRGYCTDNVPAINTYNNTQP